MKRYFLILSLSLSPLAAFCQSASNTISNESFCVSEKSPAKFMRGDTIIVSCDSLFLMNPKRYAFYKSIHSTILSNNDSTLVNLLNSYEQRLKEHQQIIDELLLNSKLAESISFDLIESTHSSIATTQKTIVNSQMLLESSSGKLDHAKEDIKKSQIKSTRNKLLFGAGGFGAGVVLGLLLMN